MNILSNGARSWTLDLPLPHRILGGNSRANHFDVNEARAVQKNAAAIACRLAHLPRHTEPDALKLPVTLSAVYFCGPPKFPDGGYVPRDDDNARRALKSAIDGLVAYGAVKDDTHRRVKGGPIRILDRKSEHGGKRGLVLIITEAPLPGTPWVPGDRSEAPPERAAPEGETVP